VLQWIATIVTVVLLICCSGSQQSSMLFVLVRGWSPLNHLPLVKAYDMHAVCISIEIFL